MASSSLALPMIAPSFFSTTTTTSKSKSTLTTTTAAAAATTRPPLSSSCAPPPKLQQQRQELKALIPFQFQFQFLPNRGFQFQPNPNSNPNPNPNPVLIDVQDSCDNSVLFSFGIAEQCTRHEEILRYLMSGSASPSGPGPDHLSQLSHLLGFEQCVPLTPEDRRRFLLSPDSNRSSSLQMPQEQAESLAHFLIHMSAGSLLSVDPAGRILFSGSPAEMKDLLSILAEFDFPLPLPHTSSPPPSKVSLLVPYFDRSRLHAKAGNKLSALNFPTETVAPSRSTGTNITKSPLKKRQKKHTSYNRDIFQKNYFHACESLLSLLLDKSCTNIGRAAGTSATILSLRKLGPEISRILTSFSIGIAGTGLAVLLSVACKMASPGTRVPLSATRLFNTGFGLGLFWLSWAVKGLRDAIVQVFKGSSKLKIKDDEMALKVERSLRDVLFRAGALVALAALRFA